MKVVIIVLWVVRLKVTVFTYVMRQHLNLMAADTKGLLKYLTSVVIFYLGIKRKLA